MSEMREAMKSWIKNECLDEFFKVSPLKVQTHTLQRFMFEQNKEGVESVMNTVTQSLSSLMDKKVISKEKGEDLRSRLDRAYHKFVTTPKPGIGPAMMLADVIYDIEVIGLERMVECQCGKSKPLITHSGGRR